MLIHEMKRRDEIRVRGLATARHRELLDLMRANQGLADLTRRVLSRSTRRSRQNGRTSYSPRATRRP